MAASNTIQLGLERMQKILRCLADPHLKMPIIHVAGTNGKGSVCAFEAEILKRSGYRVGRFTSPYLLDPTDSIELNGENVDRHRLQETQCDIRELADRNQLQLTSFELLTAAAFQLFVEPSAALDLAVVEVGLGGAADATNVCSDGNTLISCITPVSIDHQAFLGATVEEIAAQKAGIAKPRVPILLAQQSFPAVTPVVCRAARTNACDVFFARPYGIPHLAARQLAPLPLVPHPSSAHAACRPGTTHYSPAEIPNPLNPGAAFQHQNAVTAATLAHLLRTHPHPLRLLPSLATQITNQSILEGLRKTRWAGRMELVSYQSRQLLLDGAHNAASAKLLGDHLTASHRPITLVVSLSSPRDPHDFIEALDLGRANRPVHLIATRFSTPAHMQWVHPVPPELIAHHCTTQILRNIPDSSVTTTHNVPEALQLALSTAAASPDQLIVVCGSLYLVSDVLKIINGSSPPAPRSPLVSN